MTKKHSWVEKGLVISSPEKLYKQEKKRNGRGMGSPRRDARSGLSGLKEQRVPAAEMRAREIQQIISGEGLEPGYSEESVLARNQRVILRPGLT